MKKLAQKLHKPVIKKYKKRKVNWRFKDNIWAADLAEKGSLSSQNKSFNYLLSVIDIFTKYTWVKTLKDKTGKTVLNAFIEIVNDSNHKPSKLWVDQGRELYNQLMQEWLDNNILMHSAYNEGKSVIAERFIKTLKAKIYKKMTVDDSRSYLKYLNKIVDHNNNSYYHSIKKTPINADYSALTEKIERNLQAPKFKVNDRVRITKYKNIFGKYYIQNWS